METQTGGEREKSMVLMMAEEHLGMAWELLLEREK